MLRPVLFGNTKPMFFDNDFDHFFHQNLANFWDHDVPSSEGFKTDILDQGDHYLLQAELPGFQKEEIGIELDADTLTISASHQEESEDCDKKNNYIRKERHFRSYRRSFYVASVTPADIDAEYKDGILEVRFPKKELAAKEEVKRIEIK